MLSPTRWCQHRRRRPSRSKYDSATSIRLWFSNWFISSVVGEKCLILLCCWMFEMSLSLSFSSSWMIALVTSDFYSPGYRMLTLVLLYFFSFARVAYLLLLVVSSHCTKLMTHDVNWIVSSHIYSLSSVSFLVHHHISTNLIRSRNVGGVQRESLRCGRINTQHVDVTRESITSGRSSPARLPRWLGWSLRKDSTSTSWKSQSNDRCGAHTHCTKNVESSVESRFYFSGTTNARQVQITEFVFSILGRSS